MTELVGVTDAYVYLPRKRDFLMFDRIGAVYLERVLKRDRANAREIDNLRARGVLFEVERGDVSAADLSDPVISASAVDALRFILSERVIVRVLRTSGGVGGVLTAATLRQHIPEILSRPLTEAELDRLVNAVAHTLQAQLGDRPVSAGHMERIADRLRVGASEYQTRVAVQHLRAQTRNDVVSIIAGDASEEVDAAGPVAVVQLVLRNIPEPAEESTWDEIFAFREKKAAQALRRLRRWMSRVGDEQKSTRELELELEGLIDDYTEYMSIQKLKTQPGSIQTWITVSAAVVENLLRLRISEAVRAALEVKQRRIALLEAEQKAPGREIAYIVQARDHFPHQSSNRTA